MSVSLDSLTVAMPEAGDFVETLEPYSVIISRNTQIKPFQGPLE